jgi:hypothetical protein
MFDLLPILPILAMSVMSLGGAVGLVALNRHNRAKRREFQSLELPPEAADVMAVAILTDLRASAPGPDESISIAPEFWRATNLPNDQLLKLLEYMMHRGWATFPEFDWDTQFIYHRIPTTVAMTQSSYDMYTTVRPATPSVVVYGHAHLGAGDQIITGDVVHDWDIVEPRLRSLVRNVHLEAADQQPEVAVQLERIAEALTVALAQRDVGTSQARSALRWLAGFTNDASANAAGTGIAAAAASLLGPLVA